MSTAELYDCNLTDQHAQHLLISSSLQRAELDMQAAIKLVAAAQQLEPLPEINSEQLVNA